MGELRLKRVIGKIIILSMSVCLLNGITYDDLMVFADGGVAIDEVNFPDENFRNYVKENFDVDGDGVLSDSEISSVTEIKCADNNIQNLYGVEFFENLLYLNCGWNQLTSLDISKNIDLKSLQCSVNQLTDLDISKNIDLKSLECRANQLINIDISENKSLTYIDCSYNKLKNIDIENNNKLETFCCSGNNLISLDISKNNNLQTLSCEENLLTSLDTSGNVNLQTLSCGENLLTSLDTSKNVNLQVLSCYNNRLINLDTSENVNLQTLSCGENLLTSLDMSKNANLQTLSCENNRLTSLNISKNYSLKNLRCINNKLTNLDIYNNSNLVSCACWDNCFQSIDVERFISKFIMSESFFNYFACNIYDEEYKLWGGTITYDIEKKTMNFSKWKEQKQPIDEGILINSDNFPDNNFRNYVKTNFDNDGDGVLSDDEIIVVFNISCSEMELHSLQGVEFFGNLQNLNCGNNQLKNLDISKNSDLISLQCGVNQITSLDLSKNNNLAYLCCFDNNLSNLDVSNNINLKICFCWNNMFSYVDAESFSAFESILPGMFNPDADYYCYDNYSDWGGTITYDSETKIMNFSKWKGQEEPDPVDEGIAINSDNFPDENFRNYIKENFDKDDDGYLNDDEIKVVTSINCNTKELKSLVGIEFFENLQELHCDNNQLISLDVSNNYYLESLSCNHNQLINLEIGEKNNFEILTCGNNQLISLNLSEYNDLKHLGCSYNKLSSLDVSKNRNIEKIYCSNNQLTSLDISKNSNLQILYCSNNQLTGLDVSKNDDLQGLYCGYNQIISLDVSSNYNLIQLDCYYNQLINLDVGKNYNLQFLYCSNNQLPNLDISEVGYLKNLNCSNNKLNSLDLSNCINILSVNCEENNINKLDLTNDESLQLLNCDNNLLKEIDITPCKNLRDFSCANNYIKKLDLSNCPDLSYISCNNNEIRSLDFSNLNVLNRIYCWDNCFSNITVNSSVKCIPDNYDTDEDFNDFTTWGGGITYNYSSDGQNTKTVKYSKHKKYIIPNVYYKVQIQKNGWEKSYLSNGVLSGTVGEAKRLEAIRIKLLDSDGNKVDTSYGSVLYKTHVQKQGWEKSFVRNDGISGTVGKGLRLEAIQIKLEGEITEDYDIYYQVQAEKFGWLGWAKNGESAGTAGYGYRLEAIKIKLVSKESNEYKDLESSKKPFYDKSLVPKIAYKTQVQTYGWEKKYAQDGAISGTVGKAKRLEAIRIKIAKNPENIIGLVRYRTHVQKVGWQQYVQNDILSGTVGKGLRLEAIEIKLTGDLAEKYDVYYRVQAQKFGWLGWAKNGESAGTSGYGYRLEAIQIQLAYKDTFAPGSTRNAFKDKSGNSSTPYKNVRIKENTNNKISKDKIYNILKNLNVPDNISGSVSISDLFYWSGGDMSLYTLSFNGDNGSFACADCSGGNIIKGISKYSVS